MTTISNIDLFYPLMISSFCFVIFLAYSLIKLKHTNAEHSETKWILHKTFNKTIDHEENTQKNLIHCFDKATDDIKQVTFTEEHERELHDINVQLAKHENMIKEINYKVDLMIELYKSKKLS